MATAGPSSRPAPPSQSTNDGVARWKRHGSPTQIASRSMPTPHITIGGDEVGVSHPFHVPSIEYGLAIHGGSQPLRQPMFRFRVRQQPLQAVACGDQESAPRKARLLPVDPPPICELLPETQWDVQFLCLPELCVRATLIVCELPYAEVAGKTVHLNPIAHGREQSSFTANFNSPDAVDSAESLFIFGELGIRPVGTYRIRFDLIDRVELRFRCINSICTDVFRVSERKGFAGLLPSTSLVQSIAKCGYRLRIIPPSKAASKASAALKRRKQNNEESAGHFRSHEGGNDSRKALLSDRQDSLAAANSNKPTHLDGQVRSSERGHSTDNGTLAWGRQEHDSGLTRQSASDILPLHYSPPNLIERDSNNPEQSGMASQLSELPARAVVYSSASHQLMRDAVPEVRRTPFQVPYSSINSNINRNDPTAHHNEQVDGRNARTVESSLTQSIPTRRDLGDMPYRYPSRDVLLRPTISPRPAHRAVSLRAAHSGRPDEAMRFMRPPPPAGDHRPRASGRWHQEPDGNRGTSFSPIDRRALRASEEWSERERDRDRRRNRDRGVWRSPSFAPSVYLPPPPPTRNRQGTGTVLPHAPTGAHSRVLRQTGPPGPPPAPLPSVAVAPSLPMLLPIRSPLPESLEMHHLPRLKLVWRRSSNRTDDGDEMAESLRPGTERRR